MSRVFTFRQNASFFRRSFITAAAFAFALFGTFALPNLAAQAEKRGIYSKRTVKISPTRTRVISVARGKGSIRQHHSVRRHGVVRHGSGYTSNRHHRVVRQRGYSAHTYNPYFDAHGRRTAGQWLEKYRGPLVINVPDALEAKGIRLIAGAERGELQVLRPQLRNDGPSRPGEPRIIYFDEKKCSAGEDCTLYLGNQPRSPKIIVVGRKAKTSSYTDNNGVTIIRRPIN